MIDETQHDDQPADSGELTNEILDRAFSDREAGERELLSDTHVGSTHGESDGTNWEDENPSSTASAVEFVQSFAPPAEEPTPDHFDATETAFKGLQERFGEDLDIDILSDQLQEGDLSDLLPAERLTALVSLNAAENHVLSGDYQKALESIKEQPHLLDDLHSRLDEDDSEELNTYLSRAVESEVADQFERLMTGVAEGMEKADLTERGLELLRSMLSETAPRLQGTTEEGLHLVDTAKRLQEEEVSEARRGLFYTAFNEATGQGPEGMYGRNEDYEPPSFQPNYEGALDGRPASAEEKKQAMDHVFSGLEGNPEDFWTNGDAQRVAERHAQDQALEAWRKAGGR